MNANNQKNKYQSVSDEKRSQLIDMTQKQSIDLREAAALLGIKYKTAWTISNSYKKDFKIVKSAKGGSTVTVLKPEILSQIEDLVSIDPEITLRQIKDKLIENHPGFIISLSSINLALEKLIITIKKSHRELEKVNEEHYIKLRQEFAIWFNERFPNEFDEAIFVDESPFNLHLKRQQARSKKGTRANIRIPTVRGRSVSLIASIGIGGMHFSKIIDNSTVNGDIFASYIKELCSFLRDVKGMNNVCIILDNARIHRKKDMEEITSEFGFQFKFLAPYSYMLNPIETSFSKIKNAVKSMLRNKSNGSLSEFILNGVEAITVNDCIGYFRHMTRNLINSAAGLPYVHQ